MDLAVRDKKVFAATGGRPLDPTKPLVVLLHGAGQDRTIWVLQTRYLAHHGFAVLSVDFPGHGGSAGPALVSIEDMSDWVAEVIRVSGFDSAALVGHSMGALVAIQCAADHRDLIKKVALVSVSAEMPVHPQMLAAAEADEQHAIDLMVGWSHSASGHRGGHQQPGSWMLGASKRVVERSAPGVLYAGFLACMNRGSILDAATKVDVPALFLLGGDDKMTPVASGQQVASAMRDATVTVFPNVGHSMLAEVPDQVTQALTTFLS